MRREKRVVHYFRKAKAFNREERKGFAKVAKKSKIEIQDTTEKRILPDS
jgi:hypothetical protein